MTAKKIFVCTKTPKCYSKAKNIVAVAPGTFVPCYKASAIFLDDTLHFDVEGAYRFAQWLHTLLMRGVPDTPVMTGAPAETILEWAETQN